jgi:dipeptidyl aminopeptidase/acylaminoacyl peptidase
MYVKLKNLIILTLLTSLFMPLQSFATASTTIIPRKILFSDPDKVSVTLSHDGKYIGYLAPKDGVLNIWISDSNNLSKAFAVTNEKKRRINSYIWAYDNKNILYTQDEKGDENYRLYQYNIETKETSLLTPKEGVRSSIVGMSHKLPNKLLISVNDRDKRYFDIYQLDLTTGKKQLLLKNDRFSNFIVDNNLQIRFASIATKDGGMEYYQLKNNEWDSFLKVATEDATNTYIAGFDNSTENLYIVDSREHNTAVLKIHNLLNQTEKIIAQDPLVDIAIFTTHPTNDTVQAVAINYTKTSYKILDSSIAEDIKYLTNLHHGNLNINSRTLDDNNWLVAYETDDAPVKYYKYDRSNRSAKLLFTNRPDLAKYTLLKMHPIVIKSRDGLDLVSYITFPTGTKLDTAGKPDHPSPLILYVHGGPNARDVWGFNATHQWLANRGYTVVSVNYRGSTGFGKNFINAANKEWGGKMHDDLIDTVNWAVANKLTDADKIAIMGGSYGGYATLVGITMTPDIFACGIDLVGPSNLLTLINSIPPYWEPFLNSLKKKVGGWDSEKEKEFLRQRSPINFIDNIKKPLLIAQGANDPRVKQAESDQIVNAMQAKNIPVIYALYEDEGHGFARPENRISYFALVERFLSKILGGKIEDIGSDLQGANLLLNHQKNITNDLAKIIIDQAIK